MISEKVYQMFILGSGNLDYALKKGAGGVIFFKDDILSETQFKDLIKEIKIKSKITPFLSIDQEGGRVERTENIHPKKYLSPMFAFQKGEQFLKTQTFEIAEELISYGINMNFAPCLDVNSNPNNPIIGERAFSNNPDDVCVGYDIVNTIYSSNGIIPVIKHFPGHGDTTTDSHKELPVITLSFDEMYKTHISPFKYAIDKGAEAIMVAHLYCQCFDKEEIPTSLSKNCINYIRNSLNFNGVLISDDMFMKGVSKYGLTQACLMGIYAGINMFIYRNSTEEVISMIEEITKLAENDSILRDKIETSYNRIIELKHKYGISK